MTKAQFVEAMASDFGLTKKLTGQLLEATFERMGKTLTSGRRFWWPGFGVWEPRTRKSRTIRNPQTGELMKIPRTYTVGFTAAKELKARAVKTKNRRAS